MILIWHSGHDWPAVEEGSTGSSPSLMVKNTKANIGKQCWWATDVAVPCELGLETEEVEAGWVALAAWHGRRAARGMASISSAERSEGSCLVAITYLLTYDKRA